MEKALEAVNVLWPVLLGGLGLVVWLIRMEGKNHQNEKDVKRVEEDFKEYKISAGIEIKDLKSKIDLVDSEVMKQISQIKESLARIEGALSIDRG